MKLLKTITITFTFIVVFAMPNKMTAQVLNKSILIIRVYEGDAKEKWTKIIVTENGTKLEEIPLSPFNVESIESNQLVLGKTIQKYVNMGYTMSSAVATQRGIAMSISTYIYEKDNK